MTGNPTRFAVLFTLGNFIALAGTTFLSGPKSQLKSMTDKTRLFGFYFYYLVSIVYVISMIMTLISAFVIKSPPLILIFIII